MRSKGALLVILLLAVAPVHAASSTQHHVTIWRRHVVSPLTIRVWDGDTFYTGGETIRLRGIDTPELGQPRSRQAARRLGELLRAGPVTIVPRAEDVYGRTVAKVYVGGRDVAAVLRREGFAKPPHRRAASPSSRGPSTRRSARCCPAGTADSSPTTRTSAA